MDERNPASTNATGSAANVLPSGTRLGRTALRVSDLDETADFYRNVVGLEVLRRSGSTAVLGVGGSPLLVLDGDEGVPPRHRSGTGLYHNAFRVPSLSALGDALRRIRDRWRLGGASDHDVSEALYLSDPEGNGVEIYRDFPREEWPLDDGGRVRIGTRPLDLDRISAAAVGESRVPAETDVGHVHLEASSLAGFREFAVDTLGFEVQTAIPGALFVSAGGYHHHLAANTWQHRTEHVAGRGVSWFEVLLPTDRSLAAVRERVVDSRFAVTDTADGISVTDADGLEIRFRVAA